MNVEGPIVSVPRRLCTYRLHERPQPGFRRGFLSPTQRTALMNPRYYHTPIPSTRVRCPVCHEAVYSRAGIHPQCAVRQADPPRPKDKNPKKPDQPAVDAVIPPPAVELVAATAPIAVP
ncbi:MAG: hypothetical protein ACLQGP_04695 [Isosphaeraceae bacterium]